ncbi:low affinity iron permease family protein [Rhodoplanes sp. Z2-YC6860]|uniref:low affinity iron permease family protein n=1 Tax=Rhodoplanes sp. Z2-YC6860 TaxID=674703 RepID=UPI00082C755B|nr:low affinity iron permease family protein [Rhodoplanes sp. Z2-YC6860]
MRAGLPVSQIGASQSGGRSWFSWFANRTAQLSGKPATFLLATGSVVVWAVTGPFFHFSDTWQLVINTSTTIVTFLMVFLIQNTQNRDTAALQVKLDELILALDKARNNLVGIEEESEEIIENLKQQEHRKARGISEMNGAEA